MQFQNLLLKISLVLFLVIYSCTKTEYVEVPKQVFIVKDSIIIDIAKDSTGFFGASGYINGILKEYQGAEYGDSPGGNGIQIANFEWYENTFWATREVITILNFDLGTIGDTIILESLSLPLDEEPYARIDHVYFDGDVGAECYKILDSDESTSWYKLIEFHELNGLVGTINADFVISGSCGNKFDPDQPDTIRIRDLYFRARMRS